MNRGFLLLLVVAAAGVAIYFLFFTKGQTVLAAPNGNASGMTGSVQSLQPAQSNVPNAFANLFSGIGAGLFGNSLGGPGQGSSQVGALQQGYVDEQQPIGNAALETPALYDTTIAPPTIDTGSSDNINYLSQLGITTDQPIAPTS